LIPFAATDEAVAGLALVQSDYRRHWKAARSAAERELAADRAVPRLLWDAGL
jgi:hypothetical protein